MRQSKDELLQRLAALDFAVDVMYNEGVKVPECIIDRINEIHAELMSRKLVRI